MMELQASGTSQSTRQAIGAYLRTFARLSPNSRRLLLGTICLYIGIGVFGVLFNLYLVALGYSLAFIGLIAAVTTVGQAVISPLVGWFMRLVGARLTMAAGMAVLVLALLLAAIVTNAAALTIIAVLWGAALSVATVPAAPYMMEHATAGARSHLFSAYFAATTIGSMIGSLLSGALPALAALMLATHGNQLLVGEDRVGLVAGAVLAAIGIWLFWSMRAEAPSADSLDRPVLLVEEETAGSDLRHDVLIMLAATGLIALAMGATMPFFNVYFSSRLHASTATIGTIYAFSGVVCTVAAFLAPAAGRAGRLQGFTAARMLTGPVFVLFWLHPALLAAVAAYIGRNTLGTISGALENTFAMEVLPARLRGTVASWRSFVFNGAWSVGSLAAGVVVASFGYDVIFVCGGAVTLIGSAIYFLRFVQRVTQK